MTGIIKTDQIQGAGSSTVTIPAGNTLNVADDLTVDTNTLHVDASNNKVGIGTTSPEETLEVVHATAPAIQLNRTNDGGFKSILRQQGNDFEIRGSSGSTKIYTGNADGDSSTARMIINASGHSTLPSQPSCLVKKNGNLSAPQNSAFSVTGWTSVHDVGSMFSSSNSRITVPTAGSYIVGAALQASGTTGLHIAILKNDAAIGTDSYLNVIDAGAVAQSICVTASADDYFTVSAYVTHSGLNIQGNRSKFWLVKVA